MTTTLNVKIMKRGKIDTTFTQIYKFSLSWLGIGIKITTGGVDIAIWTETSRLSEVMRSCMCFPNGSKMSTLTYT